MQGRTPASLFDVAWTWTNLEFFALASDVCPRCSATLDVEMRVCEDHDATDPPCRQCGNRHATTCRFRCPNCILAMNGTARMYFSASTDLLAFMTAHGYNPVSPDAPADVQRVYSTFDEEVLSTDPFEARFTFAIDRESLTLTVDDDLSVVKMTRSRTADPVR